MKVRIICILILFSCVNIFASADSNLTKEKLSEAITSGTNIELIDAEVIEAYHFRENVVLFSVGKRGGAITAPSAEWRIKGEHLEIGFFRNRNEKDQILSIRYRYIEKKEGIIVLEGRNGNLKKFSILPPSNES